MLYAPNGQIISGEAAGVRHGHQVDGYAMPNGCIVSAKFTRDFHNRIKNDSRLRERIESAQKLSHAKRVQKWIAGGMVGKKPTMQETIHLAMLRNNNPEMTNEVRTAIEKNVEHGEKVMRKRIHDEGAALERSAVA
jgi:hypothetical protein